MIQPVDESVLLFIKLTHGDRCQVRHEGRERTAIFDSWWRGKPTWRLVRVIRGQERQTAKVYGFGRRDILEFTRHRLRDGRLSYWSPARQVAHAYQGVGV